MNGTPEQRRALAELLLARGLRGPDNATGPTAPAVPVAAGLSRGQRRLWFLEQMSPGTAQNNIALELELDDPPDRDQLSRALAGLHTAHEALRYRFTAEQGEPVQQPVDGVRTPLDWHDLTGLPPADALARADVLTERQARAPIPLDDPPLYRAMAAVLPGGRWRLVLVFHHIVVDGWSTAVLLEDLAALLAGGSVQRPAMSLAQWVDRHDDGEPAPRVVRYWRTRFADRPAGGTFAPRDPASAVRDRRGGLVPFEIDPELTARIGRLAGRLGVSVYVVCLTAFALVLRRMGDEDTVVVGAPVAGREDPRLDRVVGFFVRTLALRADLPPHLPFDQAARQVHQVVLEALDHQPMPFEDLVALAGRSGSDGPNALFRTMFAWHDFSPTAFTWRGKAGRVRDLDTGTAKFDATFSMTQAPDGLGGVAEWAADGADEVTVRGAVEAFHSVLDAVAADPGVPVGEVPLGRLLRRQETPADGGPRGVSLADGLVRQAAATPDAVAVIDAAGGSLTYAALAGRIAAAAACLRDQGLVPGDRVAVLLDRSVDMVVAVHAVAAVGCSYVPIDTGSPPQRIGQLVASAGVRLVLLHERTRYLLPDGPWPVLDVRAAGDRTAAPPLRTTPAPPMAAGILFYTSGSTGQPKPVMLPADAVQACMDWLQSRMPIGPGDRMALKTPYGFDVSAWELFWPLQRGGTVVVTGPTGHLDPDHLVTVFQRHRVGLAIFVPSLLEVFLDHPGAAGCTSLRWIFSVGEQLSPALRDRVHERFGDAALVNLYGPTETGAVTAHFLDRGRRSASVPVGSPIPYTRLHVLDENMRPLPPGLHGELYVGGDLGVATGYWGRPAQTADRFVPDPFSELPGRRLYRTGDLCRLLPDGSYEYLGRADRQLKLHGVRMEPAEIETVLAGHPAVATARVAVLGDGDERELVAFCAIRPDHGHPGGAALRAHAATRLPRQLVPRTVVELDRLPVTVNGKTDTDALRRAWREHRLADRPAVAVTSGDDPLEYQVAAAFEEVLGRTVADREQSFFDLGGGSLLLLRLAAALHRRTGHRVTVAQLVERPTVTAVTAVIRDRRAARADLIVPLAPVPGAPRLVLLPAASGSALPYLALSRALAPGLSVYGAQSPGLDGSLPPPRTVAGFVDALLPGVESLAAEGPLLLGGWSFGGALAYELALALEALGKPPAATVLLDAWVCAEPAGTVQDTAEAMAYLATRGLMPDDLPAPDRQAMETVVGASLEAFAVYRPERAPSGPVHLVRAAAGHLGEPVPGYTDDRGWAAVVNDLRVSDIDADHYGLMLPAALPALAAELRRIAGAAR